MQLPSNHVSDPSFTTINKALKPGSLNVCDSRSETIPSMQNSIQLSSTHVNDHNYTATDGTSLKLGSLNVCGLKSKLNLGIFDTYVNNFDILCLCETKTHESDSFYIPNYKFIQTIKKNVNHKFSGIHGIGIFVINRFK